MPVHMNYGLRCMRSMCGEPICVGEPLRMAYVKKMHAPGWELDCQLNFLWLNSPFTWTGSDCQISSMFLLKIWHECQAKQFCMGEVAAWAIGSWPGHALVNELYLKVIHCSLQTLLQLNSWKMKLSWSPGKIKVAHFSSMESVHLLFCTRRCIT